VSDAADVSYLSQRLLDALEPALGKHTAMRALELVCKKTGVPAQELGPAEIDGIRSALRPMLRTLLGREKTDQLLDKLM
jgi:hypothetical protein